MDVLYNFLVRPILSPRMEQVKDGVRKVFKKQKSKEFDENEQHDLVASKDADSKVDIKVLNSEDIPKESQESNDEYCHIDFEA